MMEFRIEPVEADPEGATGAFVFTPAPFVGAEVRVLLEAPARDRNNRIGPHGWSVSGEGLAARRVEKRGNELWVFFGREISFYMRPDEAVQVTLLDTEAVGEEIWPPIARGDETPPPPYQRPAPTPPPPPPAPAPPPPPAPPLPPPEPPPTTEPLPTPEPPKPEPVTPKPVTPEQPVKPVQPSWPLWGALAAVLLLLAAGGGAWWWLHRPAPSSPEAAVTPPPPPAPAPAPAAPPAPVAPPAPPPAAAAADPCQDAAAVLARRCPPERLAALPAAQQTVLADALMALGGPEAGNIAVALLGAAGNTGDPAAMLRLGRLYDPATFRAGGPLSAANPARALDLYGRAAAAGNTEASTARETLVERLRTLARGNDAEATKARQALAAAGIAP
ncbi:Sel1 repeat family protein [Rhodovastum atsumiense]|uniref:Sel1 repeat family protein n=1 Tax=Rhodovastum atsumiense TaxID=504468 RepID=A0A5M6IV45_9PROT|nr:sel1 repeat family protein [Rhodovastum atsumiense]KAA5612183.1 sel1 repeat family protein [Rhodovastum atsumiense]CAH2603863.1 Sel1 repeat family protein [Rhodovastum atsumiense]